MSSKTRRLIFAILLLVLTACGLLEPSTQTPQLTEQTATPSPIPTRLTALLVGTLELTQTCLRVNDTYTSYALVWPPELTVTIEQTTIRVQTEQSTQMVFQVGDTVELGGGVTDLPSLTVELRATIPAACSDPYWFVTNIRLHEAQ